MQQAAVAAVPGPGTAVMMAPRAMAIHPGFWMYPGGATAQWPMAYPPNWSPYAYGYYPFQVGRNAAGLVQQGDVVWLCLQAHAEVQLHVWLCVCCCSSTKAKHDHNM
jgi:hypothetical protein